MRIAICGVGALGSLLAVLCRNFATLRLIDFDRVEPKNLLSQAFVKRSIGENKAMALQRQLAEFYGIDAEAFGVRLTADNIAELLGDAELLVDCFDNFDSRTLLADYAGERGVALVHAGLSADGSFGLVRWSEQFSPDREDVEGHATCEAAGHLPMISLLASVLARTVQDYVETGIKHNSIVGLGGASRT